MANRAFPEWCLERIVEEAIRRGCLFELLFTEAGRQFLRGWREDQIRNMVFKKLKIKSKGRGNDGGA